jgi:hypothetical protein
MRTILLSFLSITSIISFGSLFAEARLLRLVLGLGISTLFITPLLYINVSLVRPAQIAVFVIGLLLYLNLIAKNIRKYQIQDFISKSLLKRVFVLGSYLIAVGFFLGLFSSSQYTYESHDVLYLGWLQEIWARDYSGPLRVPTMWPEAMGVANNLSGMVVAQVAVLEPSMNLEVAIQVKFALLLITLVYGLMQEKKTNLWKSLGKISGIGLCAMLYSGEIGTSLLLSSFWYVIILLTLLGGLLKFFPIDFTTIILMLILLIAAKSQLMLLPLLMIFLLYKWDRTNFKEWRVVVFLIGLMANMMVWAIGPKSSGGDLGIPTILDIRPRQIEEGWQIDFSNILGSSNLITDWYTGSELRLIGSIINSGSQLWLAIVLLIVKIYLPYYLLRKRIQIERNYLKLIDLYMVSSVFSWLLIRNGGHAGHQAHAFLLAPLVTSIFILKYTSENARKFSLYGLIGLVALPINLLLGSFPLAKNIVDIKKKEISAVRNSDIKIRDGIEPMSKKQVVFSIEGNRLSYNPRVDYTGSQVANFTVGR